MNIAVSALKLLVEPFTVVVAFGAVALGALPLFVWLAMVLTSATVASLTNGVYLYRIAVRIGLIDPA